MTDSTECKLTYKCGCVFKSELGKGVYSYFLCKVHYKQVANYNATHKIIPFKIKECKPRWELIK